MKTIFFTILFVAAIFVQNAQGRPENIFQKVPEDLKFDNAVLEKSSDSEIRNVQNLTDIHTYPPSQGLSGTSYKSVSSSSNVD